LLTEMIAIFLEAIEAVANGIGRSTKYPWIPMDTQKYPSRLLKN
jgi:hypothetical protein